MEKINGEAAHFSGRFIEGKFYIVTGSKNVHLMIQNKEQIEYYTEERYSLAKKIATTVCEHFERLSDKHLKVLQNFLHHSKSTVVCEVKMRERQHVVNFAKFFFIVYMS